MMIEKEEESKRVNRKPIIIGGVIVGLLLIIGGLLFASRTLVYRRAPEDPMVAFLASVYPFPAVKIGSMTVTMKDYLLEYKALISSFSSMEGQQLPAPEQLQEVILQTLINKRVIAKLAKDYDVEPTQERIEEYFEQSTSDQGDPVAFAQELQQTFGWTVDEFKERVVRSIVLTVDTEAAILRNPSVQADRRQMSQTAHDQVVAGEEFSTVAQQTMQPFNLPESDIGFFKLSDIPAEWRDAIGARTEGEITDVLEGDKMFSFFKIQERIVAGEEVQVHLLAITVPKKTLEDLVKEYLATVEVKRYLGA